MRFLHCFFAAILFIVSNTMMAQGQRELGQLMRQRGEYYFTLKVNDPSEIRTISKICSIDGTDGRNVVAYANQQEYENLLKAGYKPELQTPPSLKANVTMWNGQGTYNWDSYLTYDQYVAMMQDFPSKAIDGRSCTLFSLGTLTTSNHRQLLGVRINNGHPEGKPKFLYSSTMHGDEITGMILMLRLIDELCTSTDSQIADLVNDLDIYILPLTNPDGTYKGGNNTVNSAQRYNGYNKDLNRNYKDYFEGDHPDSESYQDETLWTMAFADSLLFTMGGNYHGGAEVMNYPWDPVYTDHADVDWYEYVCTRYVQVARQTYSSYMSDTYSDGVTNGATWYTISGSRQDYMNAFAQCREVTVECSSVKTPDASALPNYWSYNRNAMLAFMEQTLYGVHGLVHDAVTGDAIQGVMVTVENHDINNSYVTTHSIGDFHRPIKGGTYTFTFTKQGYYPQSVQVTVADDQTVNLNIQLEPDLRLIPDFTASTTNASLGQNISFTDASIGMVSSWNWTFEGATPSTSTAQNPTGITYNTPGDYDVTLVITGPTGLTDTLTKEDYIHVAETMLVGDGGTSTNNYLPSYNYYNYSLTEQIYTPADLGEGGIITSIAFFNGGATKTRSCDFYMKSTTKDRFTGAADWITVSESDKVFSGNITMTANDWTIINFSTPFIYDGISNVVLVTDDNTGDYTSSPHMSCRVYNAESQAIYVYNDYTDYDPLSPPTSSSSNNAVLTVKNQLQITKDPFPTTPFNVTVSASPARAGSANGEGEYMFGETCTVTATPNSGYSFTGWTENGEVVSNDLTFTFMVSADRDLVANFRFAAATSGNCYYSTSTVSASSYVMGHLNGTTLHALSQSSSNVTSAESTVTPTDYGFSVDEGTTLPLLSLTAYGSEQYYISYNGRYLTRSSSNLTWNSSTSSSARWYINANGIYIAVSGGWGSSTNYYLYYDNSSNSFKISTTQNNNITFYAEGDCPVTQYTIAATASPAEGGIIDGTDIYYQGETCTLTATASTGYAFANWTENGVVISDEATLSFTVTGERTLIANFDEAEVGQTYAFTSGSNWWGTNLDITLEDLKTAIANALGTSGTAKIKSQTKTITYSNGQWRPTSLPFDIRNMYEITTSIPCEITITGTPINTADYEITIHNGTNWIGFLSDEDMSVTTAFSGLNPVKGDMIKSKDGSSSYTGTGWRGSVQTLEAGHGYIYQSKATEDKTFTFPSNH